jgi:hypothetical protein
MYNAGKVKIAPATTDPATPPIPVMITFSSNEERRRYILANPITKMEIGIADSITCPTFSPEYAEATVKIMQRNNPHPTDLHVSSGSTSPASTRGSQVSPGFSGV